MEHRDIVARYPKLILANSTVKWNLFGSLKNPGDVIFIIDSMKIVAMIVSRETVIAKYVKVVFVNFKAFGLLVDSVFENIGTNILVKAPSPSNLLKEFGSFVAATMTSLIIEAPMKFAITLSRKNPVNLDINVHNDTVRVDLAGFICSF